MPGVKSNESPSLVAAIIGSQSLQALTFRVPAWPELTMLLAGKWNILFLVWAASTGYHTLGGLNNKHLVLTVMEPGKSKTNVPTHSMSGAGLLPVS